MSSTRKSSSRAAYLHEEAGRYWFSTQPTLNRLADERARAFPSHEVDQEIVKALIDDGKLKDRFHRVFAAPDDPSAIDEALSLSLVILGPEKPHTGKGVTASAATQAVTDTLTRCRAGQRRYRNTLLFVAADEANLSIAREAMRRSMGWASVATDNRVQASLTGLQAQEVKDKAKPARDGAIVALRNAWGHVLFPVKTDATATGTPFELEHLAITGRDRAAIPQAVYDKALADGITKERLGPDALVLHLAPLWQDRPYLPVREVAEWFASYVYLPKLRDRVVLDTAIRDAVRKLDPAFGYADRLDEASGEYVGLVWAGEPPIRMPDSAVLVGAEAALAQLKAADGVAVHPIPDLTGRPATTVAGEPTSQSRTGPRKPRRFYGAVELDMIRPIKAFEAILDAVVIQLQRAPGAKVTITLDIQAECKGGFADDDVSVVRDNAKSLKFRPDGTGFAED
ncbi:MAG: hypothetical protein ACREEB_10555 [Caulobacteraceae bacterium]